MSRSAFRTREKKKILTFQVLKKKVASEPKKKSRVSQLFQIKKADEEKFPFEERKKEHDGRIHSNSVHQQPQRKDQAG